MENSRELQRLLVQHSWNNFVLNDDGVRLPTKTRNTDISFPLESWDDDAINAEGVGIWGEIRLQELHSMMSKYEISTVWEVGSGNGAVSLGLNKLGFEAIAIEPLYAGALFTANQGVASFACTFEELNLPAASIPSIGVFDVLEHIRNPKNLLIEFARVLSTDGKLVISVPAHPFLFSDYDSSIGHFRRYTLAELRESLASAGFKLIYHQYLFAFLVPLAWTLRVLPGKLRKVNSSGSAKNARTQFRIAQKLSPIFRFLAGIERTLKLPFGLSLIAIAIPNRERG
jgi:ubiquinone/menaquinone biosynthesis C-methylase UbiE